MANERYSLCDHCGVVVGFNLTLEDTCPVCGREASWDDNPMRVGLALTTNEEVMERLPYFAEWAGHTPNYFPVGVV